MPSASSLVFNIIVFNIIDILLFIKIPRKDNYDKKNELKTGIYTDMSYTGPIIT